MSRYDPDPESSSSESSSGEEMDISEDSSSDSDEESEESEESKSNAATDFIQMQDDVQHSATTSSFELVKSDRSTAEEENADADVDEGESEDDDEEDDRMDLESSDGSVETFSPEPAGVSGSYTASSQLNEPNSTHGQNVADDLAPELQPLVEQQVGVSDAVC